MKLFFKNLIIKTTAMAILLAFVASQNVSAMNQNGHGDDDDDTPITAPNYGPRNPDPNDTPLMHAAHWELGEDLQRILFSLRNDLTEDAYLAEINRQANSRDGNTALCYAAKNRDSTGVSLLLQAGADPTITNKLGEFPVHIAAGFGRTSTIGAFIEFFTQQPDLLDRVLNQRDGENRTPFIWAARNGHFETVQLLLEHTRPNIDSINEALQYARKKTFLPKTAIYDQIIQLLEEFNSPAHHTAPTAPINIQYTGPQYSARPQTYPQLPSAHTNLMNAIRDGRLETLRDNLNSLNGNEINNRSYKSHEDTALCFAIKIWDPNCFKLLLGAGADPRITNLDGDAPMHIAAKFRNLSAIQALVYYYRFTQPDLLNDILNQLNGEAKTPLMLAAEIGDFGAVGLLLRNGARPDISRPDFYEGPKTALDFARQGPPQTTQNRLLFSLDFYRRRIGSREDYNQTIKQFETAMGISPQPQNVPAAIHTAPAGPQHYANQRPGDAALSGPSAPATSHTEPTGPQPPTGPQIPEPQGPTGNQRRDAPAQALTMTFDSQPQGAPPAANLTQDAPKPFVAFGAPKPRPKPKH